MSIAQEIQRLQNAKANIKTAIENKGVTVGNGTIDTYAEKIGQISGGGIDYLYYAEDMTDTFNGTSFDIDTIALIFKNTPKTFARTFYGSNIKTVKITTENNIRSTSFNQIARSNANLEVLDLTDFNSPINNIQYAFLGCSNLKSIYGDLDLSECTATNIWLNSATLLKDISFVKASIKISLSFEWCPLLTTDSVESIFNGLALVDTAQTLTLHNNIKILQSQVDTATVKGWTVIGGTVVSEEEYYE